MRKLSHMKPIIGYFVGFVIISLLFYYFIGRFPGYVYFWDASGAFAYRDPWEQYIKTYTAYDGVEVGIKNRLPIVTIIFIITKLFVMFGFPEGEMAIKVALWLMLISAYSSFYFLFPRWGKVLGFPALVKEQESYPVLFLFVRVFVSLLYLLVPFYVYRMVHLHLFYLTTFYPLGIYFYLHFLTEDKKWKNSLWLFILSCFFGFSTPHSIVYIGLTVLFLLIFVLFRDTLKSFPRVIGRNVIAWIGVGITNLYWVVPYIMEKAPNPGYLIHENMYEFLANATSPINFLFDTSEWYLYQTDMLNGFFQQGSILRLVQYIGAFIFITFPIFFIVRHTKKNSLQLLVVVALLIIVMAVVIKDSPLQTVIVDFVLFSRYGWVIREPNRLKFIWSFWFFLFFSLQFHTYLHSVVEEVKKHLFLLNSILLGISLFCLLLYFIPRGYVYFSYFKPTPIPSEHVQLESVLSNIKEPWGGVFVFPREEGISLNWKKNTFPIANEGEYVFFPYNLPVPPVRQASVLASGRSLSDAIGQGALDGQLNVNPEILDAYGIEFVLIVKNPKNVFPYLPDLSAKITAANSWVEKSAHYEKVLDNKEYTLYRSIGELPRINYETFVDTGEGLKILENIKGEKNIKVRFIPGMSSFGSELRKISQLVYGDSEYPYLNYYEFRKIPLYRFKYFDEVRTRYLGISWGRMSLLDKTNGESYIVFRHRGLYVPEYQSNDEVIYSDILVDEPQVTVKPLDVFDETFICQLDDKCLVYVKILYSHLGGPVDIEVNGVSEFLSTYSNVNATYKWVLAGELSGGTHGVQLRITPSSGFFSLSDAVIMTKSQQTEFEIWWQNQSVTYIDKKKYNQPLSATQQNECSITYRASSKVLGVFESYTDVRATTCVGSYFTFANWNGPNLLVQGDNNKYRFIDSPVEISATEYKKIVLLTKSNIALLVLFPVTGTGVLAASFYIWKVHSHKKRK